MYRADLAAIQHRGFGAHADRAGPELLALFRRRGIRGGTVVDLGCGDGRWLARLTRAGYLAVGCDRSTALVTIARRVAPRARIVRASVDRFSIPPAAAVTALGEVLGYRPRRGAVVALRRLFRRIAAALEPGGVLAFDLMVTGRRPLRYRAWTEGPGWMVAVAVIEDTRRRELVREIVTWRRVGGRWRRARERHRVALFDRDEILEALRAAGFRATTARRYGRHRLAPRRLVFVATRHRQPSPIGD